MNKVRHILAKQRVKVAIYLSIIIGATLAVYYPSFFHILRGETYTYFMDSMGNTSAVYLIKNYFNYEMVRVFDAGDSLVFRPLLFTVLGIETALFGANYTCWHIAAFLMHLVATLCLFRLLWKIRPSIIAMFATIFFSTNFMALTTILYEQIASYALFTAFILTTIYYIYYGVSSRKTKHLVLATASMVIACYFLEIGMIFLVLFTGYFCLERKYPGFKWRRWALVFTIILCVYLGSYIVKTFPNPTATTNRDAGILLRAENINPAFSDGNRLATYWITQTIQPAKFSAEIDTNYRANPINIIPTFLDWVEYTGTEILFFKSHREGSILPVILNYIAIAIIVGVYFLKAKKGKPKISDSFLLLLTVAPFVLALANAFYRGRTHGNAYLLSDANYNIYFWMSLFVLAVYAYISFKKLTNLHKGLISLAIIILIGITAPLTYSLNQEVRADAEPIREYFQEIDNFIASKRPEDEPDFSFSSTINSSELEDGLQIVLWKGLPNSPEYTRYNFTMPEVLYWRYWSNNNPEYTLLYHSEDKILEAIKNK